MARQADSNRNEREDWMNRYVCALAVAGILTGITSAATAAPRCEWEFEKVDQNTATIPDGKKAVIMVTVVAKGTAKPQDDWSATFTAPDACPGFRQGCGTWVFTKKVTMADNGKPVTFGVENAACEGSTRTFNLTVEAKPQPLTQPAPTGALWTDEEKNEVQDHVRNAIDNRWWDLSAAFVWAPNLPTTTRVALGTQLDFNARVGSPHAKLGAGLRWLETGIPIWEGLHPRIMETTENTYSAYFQAYGVITGGSWFQLDLGGQAGVGVFHYNTSFVRQEASGQTTWVAEETTFSPQIAPAVAVHVLPHPNIGLDLGFALPIDLNPRDREVGRKQALGDGDPKVYATPLTWAGVTLFL